MTIQLYDSMTCKKEPFTPVTDGKVKIYVCGLTVYDMAQDEYASFLCRF